MRYCLFIVMLFLFAEGSSQYLKQMPISLENREFESELRLFVKADIDAIQQLSREGVVKTISHREGISLISTDRDGIEKLIQTGSLEYISTATQSGVPLNDLMITNNNILPVHQGIAPLSNALTGDGVIMGVIDTGIELLHPDFLHEDGTTRIIELWDHTFEYDEGHIPQPYGFGTRWTQEEINSGEAVHQDQLSWFGHGSTVTGTACGNGTAINDFIGVAPKSDMVIVSFDFSTSNFLEDVTLAVEYIFEVAEANGKPCVINMSLGTYFGSHDGLDPASIFIDGLLEQNGRLIAAAVGNSNALAPYHLGVDIEDDTVFTWFQYENILSTGGGGVFFELWADSIDLADISFSVGADKTEIPYAKRGLSIPIQYEECLGQVIGRDIVNDSMDILGTAQYWAQYRGAQIQMQVFVSDPDSSQYDFRFSGIGTGAYDIWSTSAFGTSDMVYAIELPSIEEFPEIIDYVSPDKQMHMVSSWTCSERVMTVANYMNRVSYLDYTGAITTVPGIQGDINSSSSAGPTRDGRQKPDIAATGSVTLSTGSFSMLSYLIQNEPFKVAQGGMHFRNGGSSMASPVLAGIAALYLEQCPEANWEAFKEAVTATSAVDGYTGLVPNNYWGYGKVNGYGAIAIDAIQVGVQQEGDQLIATGGTSYQWFLNDAPIEGGTEDVLIVSGAGNYLVEAFNDLGCSVFSDVLLVTDLDSYSQSVLSIYPNPASTELLIEGVDSELELMISDSYGRLLRTLQTDHDLVLDVSRMSSGLYLLEIHSGKSVEIKKLIIK